MEGGIDTSIQTEAERLRRSIREIVRNYLAEDNDTKACFRVYRAVVTEAPDSTTKKCKVRLAGQDEEMALPYSSACSDAAVGDLVWIGTISNSFSNAIVWQKNDFS